MRPRAVERIAWHQRPRRKNIVEVTHDDGGFDDNSAVMDSRRHHAVRIELEISGIELMAIQSHQVAFPFPFPPRSAASSAHRRMLSHDRVRAFAFSLTCRAIEFDLIGRA